MKLYHLFLMLLFFVLFNCNDGYLSLFRDRPFNWPKRIGGINDDSGGALASDSSGNIIITGYITGSVDLNNDGDVSDAFENDDADSSTDIFIIKYTPWGTFKWAKRLGGVSGDKGYGVAADSQDNIIVTGTVTGDADLNGDSDFADDGESSAGYGSRDVFVVKFNSSGTYLWSKRLGGASDDEGQRIVTDSSDNIIITGIIEDNADLNGNGSIEAGLPETATVTYGGSDLFVSKFDSSGNSVLTIRLGGADLNGDINSIAAVDSNSNIILNGSIYQDADLDGDDLLSGAHPENIITGPYGFFDIFISKFDSSGNWQWSKRLGTTLIDNAFGITTDLNNNIMITGSVYQDADTNGNESIDAGLPETATGTYDVSDIFITKFDSSGTFQWSKRLGGIQDEGGFYIGNNIATDSANSVIVTGEVQGDADLNANDNSTDGGAEDSTGFGSYDIFVTKFDSAGNWQWAKRVGGTDADEASGIIVSDNAVFVTGHVTGNADLDGDGEITLQTPDSSVQYPEDATGFGGTDVIISVFAD